mmetsp:Transcript_21990/g.31889  ORF Transcript_21990/g.31889 Transcript_21990/m.31889 type:complete len:213 (-) Transcript_21990:1115-1753(-)
MKVMMFGSASFSKFWMDREREREREKTTESARKFTLFAKKQCIFGLHVSFLYQKQLFQQCCSDILHFVSPFCVCFPCSLFVFFFHPNFQHTHPTDIFPNTQFKRQTRNQRTNMHKHNQNLKNKGIHTTTLHIPPSTLLLPHNSRPPNLLYRIRPFLPSINSITQFWFYAFTHLTFRFLYITIRHTVGISHLGRKDCECGSGGGGCFECVYIV